MDFLFNENMSIGSLIIFIAVSSIVVRVAFGRRIYEKSKNKYSANRKLLLLGIVAGLAIYVIVAFFTSLFN